jgi:hypothetical protein
MTPGNYPFEIYQGKTTQRQCTVTISAVIVDYSSHSAVLTLRPRHGSPAIIMLTSAPGGGIVLANVAPNVTFTFTAAQTDALDFTIGVYELNITSPDGLTVDPLLEGRVTFVPEIAP